MEAKARAITFLGDEGVVHIPFFQRGYVWEQINWEDMLTDLLEFNKSHFLFERKIEGEGRKKGIRYYSELWITKADIIDKYDSGEKIWNELSIAKREKALYDELIKIWAK